MDWTAFPDGGHGICYFLGAGHFSDYHSGDYDYAHCHCYHDGAYR